MKEKSLGVLIPTLPERFAPFNTLKNHLARQVENRKVIIPICPIDRSMSIGVKRQFMLESVMTDFVVFIDDDDWVTLDYIPLVYDAIQKDPDVVGLCGYMTTNGGDRQNWSISIKYNGVGWNENKSMDGYRYVRCPNHLAPIKREHALAVGYQDMKHGEDYTYSMKLKDLGLLKKEEFIESELYHYIFKSNK